MGYPDFDSDDITLMGEVARQLVPAIPIIVQRWIAQIWPEEDKPATTELRQRLMAVCGELLGGLFGSLANGDPESAIEFGAGFMRNFLRSHEMERGRAQWSMADFFASAGIVRSIVREEIARHTAEDTERQRKALLCYTQLWAELAERFGIIYSQASETHMRALYSQALESSRRKSALIAGIVHELRTPLNVILGYADLMAERLEELNDRAGASHAEPIRRAGSLLLRTISALLDLSQIEVGAYELKPVRLKLDEVVARHVRDLAILARGKGIELSLTIDEPGAVVRFDEHCLSNAINNLIQNAIKYTERGGVFVRVYRNGAGVPCLEVRDTGIGIDPSYLPRLFEPFTHEDSHTGRGHEGNGLGLALVKRYVELNGAHIEVVSQKAAGSSFTIVFPNTESAYEAGKSAQN